MYGKRRTWLGNNGAMGTQWGQGEKQHSPDANLSGIYDITVHCILHQILQVLPCYCSLRR